MGRHQQRLWRVPRQPKHAAALLRVVPLEMLAGLAVKETMKEAWEAIRSIRVDADKVKEANAEKLQWEFDDIAFKSGECVEEFAMQISSLANQLRSLGDEILDKKVMKKMLQSMLDHLEQVAICMETLLDQLKRRRVICKQWRTIGRRSHRCLHKMRVVSCCSWRSSGRCAARHPLVKNLAGMAAEVAARAAEVTVAAMGMAEEAVTVTHELTHGKSGKKGVALMGRLRDVVLGVAS
jgi:hypothetical protein